MTELSAANSEVILPDNADVTFIVEITCDNEIIVEYTKEVQPLALNRTTNELTGIANILITEFGYESCKVTSRLGKLTIPEAAVDALLEAATSICNGC